MEDMDKKSVNPVGAMAAGAIAGAAVALVLSDKDRREKIKRKAKKISEDLSKNFTDKKQEVSEKTDNITEKIKKEVEDAKKESGESIAKDLR